MRADRLMTLFILLASLGFVFVAIPYGTEHVDSGVTTPGSLPRVLGWSIAILAAIQLANPFEKAPEEAPDARQLIRALAVMALAGICAWLIPVLGFLPSAIILSLGACMMMRERRWPIVAIAGLVLPVLIWAAVTQLLGRPLP